MKNMKKVFAFLLTVIMVMGMATSVFAHTITLTGSDAKPTTGHTYSVYQLFTGELQADGSLEHIVYGTAGLGTVGEAVPKTDIDAINDARAYAQSLDIDSLTDCGALNADNNWTLTDVASGYYLIVDEGVPTQDGDSYSAYIVKVVKDVEMAPKSSVVTSDKKEYNDAEQLVNVNDAGVGTVVTYDLTAKIAENAGDYDYYFFVLRDTLSSGLTFNEDIVVTIDGQPAVEGTDYAVYYGENGYTFEIALLDAKSHANADVHVNYSATLNSDAVAMIPETNTYDVEYSRKPEHEYKGDKDDTKPGKPGPSEDSEDVFGTTPEKTTKTYTTKLDLTKVDANDQTIKLAGATFRLTSNNANQTIIKTGEAYQLDNENGTWYLLKDGTYTQTAPTDNRFVATGSKGDANTKAGYIKVEKDGVEEYIVPAQSSDYAGEDLYILMNGTESQYASTNKYSLVTTNEVVESVAAPVDVTLTTDENGVLCFDQLGTGTYTLTEIDAPDGYNYINPITFTVTFVPSEDGTTGTFEVTSDAVSANAGILSTTVEDEFGSTLPETGGIGTTLFYVIGSVLVFFAGVLLITKKRMSAR